MSGTLERIRFYAWSDTGTTEVDYAIPLTDYPDYPRDAGVDFSEDVHKSALGSNYWRYYRGQTFSWTFDWVDVSEDCQATMGIICGSMRSQNAHVAIFAGNGIDGISLASLLTVAAPTLLGTFFCEDKTWRPQERVYGLWQFTTTFRQA